MSALFCATRKPEVSARQGVMADLDGHGENRCYKVCCFPFLSNQNSY